LEHRFTKGYYLLVGYTWSKFTERVSKLNATDTSYEERPSSSDTPHRVAISSIYELPFGKGRHWLSDSSRAVNALVGGWSVQALGQFQTGFPIDFGNLYYNGDPRTLKAHYSNNVDVPVFDISGFYFHDAAVQTNGVDDPVKQRQDTRKNLASNVRYFPSRIDGIRGPILKTWDISIVKQVAAGGHRAGAVQRRVPECVQPDVLQQRQHGSDQRELRQGDDPEQPAARHPARVQDRVLR
jgi:hypothetical protein